MDIKIPHLGEGADSGTVVSILVKEGDKIAKDQTIIELENEKAVAPIPSSHAGVVKKIYIKVGDKVSVGQAILSIEGGEEAATPAPSSGFSPLAAAEPSQTARVAEKPVPVPPGVPPPASPTVRRLAMELGIDLTKVRGSEAGGRIVMADLRAYIAELQSLAFRPTETPSPVTTPKPAPEAIDFSKWGPVTRKPISGLRQKIGQKMAESWTNVPHVTQFDEADITRLVAMRKKYLPQYVEKDAPLTITPFVMKAAVAALKKYPSFNASLDLAHHELILKNYYHLGVAVDTEAGLIVPVIRDVDKKSLLQIARDLNVLAEKTRKRTVSAEELKGGTFTISNLGSIGGSFFTPIVNVPEAAILGVGRGMLKPMIGENKNVEPRLVLPLALSYDHRMVDGADGARFIRLVVETLENFKEEDIKI